MTRQSPIQTPVKPRPAPLAQYRKAQLTPALSMVRPAMWLISSAPSRVPSNAVAHGAKGCTEMGQNSLFVCIGGGSMPHKCAHRQRLQHAQHYLV